MSTFVSVILTDFSTVLFLFVAFVPFHVRLGTNVATLAFVPTSNRCPVVDV